MSLTRTIPVILVAVAVAGALILQRHRNDELRSEIALLGESSIEIARLQQENQRLQSLLPDAPERARIRAKHDAEMRLQADVDRIRAAAELAEASAREMP